MQANANTQFEIGQNICVTYKNGIKTEGTVVEVRNDRLRAVPKGQIDDGIGFGFAFRAINYVITVDVV